MKLSSPWAVGWLAGVEQGAETVLVVGPEPVSRRLHPVTRVRSHQLFRYYSGELGKSALSLNRSDLDMDPLHTFRPLLRAELDPFELNSVPEPVA